MEKIEFTGDLNNIEDIVKHLNDGLNNGYKVSDLRKIIGIGEKALQKKLKENKYKYKQKDKAYCKCSDDVVEVKEDNYKVTTNAVTQDNYKITTDSKTQDDYKVTTEILSAVSKMNEMSSKFEKMYEWYELQTNPNIIDIDVDANELKIKPNENLTVTRSMRFYADTYERFNKFCKSNKDKKVQDILETAMREFLDKYDK